MKHNKLLPFTIVSLGLIGLSIGLTTSLSAKNSYQKVEAAIIGTRAGTVEAARFLTLAIDYKIPYNIKYRNKI